MKIELRPDQLDDIRERADKLHPSSFHPDAIAVQRDIRALLEHIDALDEQVAEAKLERDDASELRRWREWAEGMPRI